MEPKGCQKGAKWSPKGAKREPKGDQNASKNRCTKKGAKIVVKSYAFGSVLESFLVQKPEKAPSENHLKFDAEKVEKMRSKSSKNGAKTGSKIMKKTKGVICLNHSLSLIHI